LPVAAAISDRMLSLRGRTDGFVASCIPSLAHKPPAGPEWVHEIKHDGYRLIVRRDGAAVRLYTRRGYDWIHRYPAIADGVAVFVALHCRHRATDAMYAFDLSGARRRRPAATAARRAQGEAAGAGSHSLCGP
jgi:ATP-dependent DNA ligase